MEINLFLEELVYGDLYNRRIYLANAGLAYVSAEVAREQTLPTERVAWEIICRNL